MNKVKAAILGTVLVGSVSAYVYDQKVNEPGRVIDRCFKFKTELPELTPFMEGLTLKVTGEDKDGYKFKIQAEKVAPENFNDSYTEALFKSEEVRLDKMKFRDFFDKTKCN